MSATKCRRIEEARVCIAPICECERSDTWTVCVGRSSPTPRDKDIACGTCDSRTPKDGVIWKIKVNSGDVESTTNKVLQSNILYNPLSYECYRIH